MPIVEDKITLTTILREIIDIGNAYTSRNDPRLCFAENGRFRIYHGTIGLAQPIPFECSLGLKRRDREPKESEFYLSVKVNGEESNYSTEKPEEMAEEIKRRIPESRIANLCLNLKEDFDKALQKHPQLLFS